MVERLKSYVRTLVRRIVLWAIDAKLNEMQRGQVEAAHRAGQEAGRIARGEVQYTMDQVAALQAIDVGFQEMGHVVIIARVGGRDTVKIVDIRPNVSLVEYRSIVKELEYRFGAKARFADAGTTRALDFLNE